MPKILIALMIFCSLVFVDAFAKYADLAGSWYSGDKDILQSEIDGYLNDAEVPVIDGDIIGVIAPHAGFVYSGSIAAYSYKVLTQKKTDLVILIGFSHRKFYPGKVSVLDDMHFISPLGKMVLDKEFSEKLIDSGRNIESIPDVFFQENSVETQIPFIQTVAKQAKLVVLAICDQRKKNCDELVDVLYSALKDRNDYILIASSDMSHYLSYDHANIKDLNTIKVIERFDPDDFYANSMQAKRPYDLMCGYGATYTLMRLSRKLGADKAQILKYGNSGDTAGNKDKVVGYLSAVFYRSNNGAKSRDIGSLTGKQKDQAEGGNNMLDQDQQKELLDIARSTILHYLETGKKLEVTTSDPLLKENMGAFVTLNKKGRLRGCIGHLTATEPLYLMVRNMAIAASVEDPRFPPLGMKELNDVDIEISVLSPMKKIDDPELIKIPGYGVMVRKGFRSGVYLPQVAEDTGWSRDEFMNSLCAQKAGIPEDSWKTGNCDIYIFAAEVFGEKHEK